MKSKIALPFEVCLVRLWNRLYVNALSYRSNRSMKGKTIVITGSTSGLGLELTKEFLRRGWLNSFGRRSTFDSSRCRGSSDHGLSKQSQSRSLSWIVGTRVEHSSFELVDKAVWLVVVEIDRKIRRRVSFDWRSTRCVDLQRRSSSVREKTKRRFVGLRHSIKLSRSFLPGQLAERSTRKVSTLENNSRFVGSSSRLSGVLISVRRCCFSLSKLFDRCTTTTCRMSWLADWVDRYPVPTVTRNCSRFSQRSIVNNRFWVRLNIRLLSRLMSVLFSRLKNAESMCSPSLRVWCRHRSKIRSTKSFRSYWDLSIAVSTQLCNSSSDERCRKAVKRLFSVRSTRLSSHPKKSTSSESALVRIELWVRRLTSFRNCRVSERSDLSKNIDLAGRVWSLSLDEIGRVPSRWNKTCWIVKSSVSMC